MNRWGTAVAILGAVALSSATAAPPAPAPPPAAASPASRAALIRKAVETLIAEANVLDKFGEQKVTLRFSRPHPALADWGADMAVPVLDRMLQPFTSGPGAEYRDTYIRWHLMLVVKKATQEDRAETGPRLLELIKKMPGPLDVATRQERQYIPPEIYAKWYALVNSGNVTVGYPPFQRSYGAPASYPYLDAAKVEQVKKNLADAEKLRDQFKVIVDHDAIAWNGRIRQLHYLTRQYRGELIYAMLLTGDPEMARVVMNEIDRQARAKNNVAFDLLAYFYLATFDGAMNLYDQAVLNELSAKLTTTAKASEGYVSYQGVHRNLADYAFHLIYMLQDGGGFITPKDIEDPRRKLSPQDVGGKR